MLENHVIDLTQDLKPFIEIPKNELQNALQTMLSWLMLDESYELGEIQVNINPKLKRLKQAMQTMSLN